MTVSFSCDGIEIPYPCGVGFWVHLSGEKGGKKKKKTEGEICRGFFLIAPGSSAKMSEYCTGTVVLVQRDEKNERKKKIRACDSSNANVLHFLITSRTRKFSSALHARESAGGFEGGEGLSAVRADIHHTSLSRHRALTGEGTRALVQLLARSYISVGEAIQHLDLGTKINSRCQNKISRVCCQSLGTIHSRTERDTNNPNPPAAERRRRRRCLCTSRTSAGR